MQRPPRNPVAENVNKYNRPATHKDKKRESKKGYRKHRGKETNHDR